MNASMQPIQLTQIATFIEGFRSVSQASGLADHSLTTYPAFFAGFRSRMQDIQAHQKQFTPDYNLFQILRIDHLEAITHTPFLFNLLKPNGSHAQGHAFVYALLKRLYNKSIIPENSLIEEVVENKSTTGLGNIDIFLRGKINNEPFAVIIENKVYAGDQINQLERYYEYVSETLGYTSSQIRLVYLTPHGIEPAIPHSISRKLFNKLSSLSVLQLWSYKKDVRHWLEECVAGIHPDSLLFGSIQQYLHIIKTW
jgi:hypothetical protein